MRRSVLIKFCVHRRFHRGSQDKCIAEAIMPVRICYSSPVELQTFVLGRLPHFTHLCALDMVKLTYQKKAII
jgi:hypothetical protein